MKALNSVKAVFPSRSVNEGFARSVVAAFASTVDPTVDELCDIRMAVSEAVTNAIVHGYRDTLGMVYITVSLYPGGLLRIKVQDKGCGIPDVQKAMEPLYTTCQTGERAGLGFAVMEEMMDRVRVKSQVGKGTTVTLDKKLTTRGE
ncbi:anti-sigma F factor [Angelakisella massiliensis]|uniref:anti-sigma F factor n=1 Tax=Angelakisella massiliensis TaxID=1871018 RepID=UPI0008F86B17|nr:anti-sigma F factor [Angelakisella massiliensis]